MAKVLIDLGTEGNPQSGDTLPAGGAKINQHIEDVYAAFSNQDIPAEDQTLSATGVYQYLTVDKMTFVDPYYEYQASSGEMLAVDVSDGSHVHILLPVNPYSSYGDQIKVFNNGDATNEVSVHCVDGSVQGQSSVVITNGVQYQFIRALNFSVDGTWSQRIITADTGNINQFQPVNAIPIEITDNNIAHIDCALGQYFTLDYGSINIDGFNFINIPTINTATTIIIKIQKEVDTLGVINFESLGGYWTNTEYQNNSPDRALLAITFISDEFVTYKFNTLVSGWLPPPPLV